MVRIEINNPQVMKQLHFLWFFYPYGRVIDEIIFFQNIPGWFVREEFRTRCT